MRYRQINLKLDDETFKILSRLAEMNDRTKTGFVRHLIRKEAAQSFEPMPRKSQKALSDGQATITA
jgi:predicted transcriptional regulator